MDRGPFHGIAPTLEDSDLLGHDAATLGKWPPASNGPRRMDISTRVRNRPDVPDNFPGTPKYPAFSLGRFLIRITTIMQFVRVLYRRLES